MIGDLFKTIGQLDDPRFLRVILKSIALSVLLFAVLWAGLGALLTQTELLQTAWLEGIADLFGGLLVVALTIILFPGVAIMVVGLFLEDVCMAVEARHYPSLPPARRQSIAEIVATTIRLGLTVLAINLLLLPLYLILLFVPPLNLLLYYAVNGHLLGREYFELVALRRVPPDDVRHLRRRNRAAVWTVGAIIAFLFTVPLIGLLVPALGTALMLHTYQRRISLAGS